MALFSHFVGRIGKIEVIEGKNGKFLSMNVATDYYSQGEVKPMWIRVRSNENRHLKWAEKAKKGSLILVEGMQVEPNVWKGEDGNAHAQIVILAEVISYVTGSGKKKDKPEEEQTPVSEELPIAPPAPDDQPEDLPF